MNRDELIEQLKALPNLKVNLWNTKEASEGGFGSGEYDITDVGVEDLYDEEDGEVVGQGISICFEADF